MAIDAERPRRVDVKKMATATQAAEAKQIRAALLQRCVLHAARGDIWKCQWMVEAKGLPLGVLRVG